VTVLEPWVYAALFGIVAVLGVRGSWRLAARYSSVHDRLDERETWILRAIVIVSWVITVAALYFGFLSVRRLLGFDALPQLVPVSAIVAIGVLLIPAFLDYVVDRVATVSWDGT
jgi:hypothetical protein